MNRKRRLKSVTAIDSPVKFCAMRSLRLTIAVAASYRRGGYAQTPTATRIR